MREKKEALTFQQQLNHLKNDKKLKIDNPKNALTILKHENYYRLSGYMIEFLNKDDVFDKNITFENIYEIYKLDKEIRTTLFALINDIEIYLKSQVSNYFSLEYGSDGYRNPLNFHNYEGSINMLKKCNDIVKNNPKNLIVKHHVEHYDGVLPIWALVELMSLGHMSKFYSLLSTKDKKRVCKIGFKKITYDKLESFYHTIAYFRNHCCHYHRLYMINHIIQPKEYFNDNFDISEIAKNSTYYMIISLLILNPNKKLGEKVIYDLKKLSEEYPDVDFCKKYGFHEKWKTQLYRINGCCIKQ